jgi:hypothetical protein
VFEIIPINTVEAGKITLIASVSASGAIVLMVDLSLITLLAVIDELIGGVVLLMIPFVFFHAIVTVVHTVFAIHWTWRGVK